MREARGKHRGRHFQSACVAAILVVAAAAAACSRGARDSREHGPAALLRVGVPGLSPTNPAAGLRQLTQILSVEGVARLGEDGRVEPWLAADWSSSDNGRSFLIHLKPGVKFHDGSPLTASSVVNILPTAMRETFGPIADDVTDVTAVDAHTVAIRFVHPSPFAFEALEAGIRKPGKPPAGTGPFIPVPNSTSELRANVDYYAGPPVLREIRVENFPSVRTAWAKMLRNELDMLWEVGPDALSSLEHSANIAVFTFTRRYQYVVAFNSASPALRSASVRRALNMAVDRNKLVQDALNGHAVASAGPVWPRYWALDKSAPIDVAYDPQKAADILQSAGRSNKHGAIHFTLLIASDAVYERIALELKRQLETIGADMDVRAAAPDQLLDALQHGQYDAVLMDGISGPTLLRPYGFWHSNMPGNLGRFGNPAVDAAFDAVRAAETEPAYRTAVANLVRTFANDPPAVFLAWSVRARAISKRFDVQGEEGRDVISTLRFWKPTGVLRQASRN